MNDAPIRAVLDTSAIIAFTTGSSAVGEAITKIADEGGLFGLPVLCLAEAYRSNVDAGRLELLVNHPAAVLLTVDPFRWREFATTCLAVERLDTASALLAAAADGCTILTEQPGRG
ncbi:hypothetical protein G3554_18435 [Micromonospora sp. PPF5-17]|uniref:PIN domain-containing protein n=2 Tax=Micromonosporaceae TaxID=28056 RepID=A0ABX9WDU0_9ACTN|nr:hypothetical protein [Micromonospora sp. PPF5-17B]NES38127.1 hypothetical protein [Micromonospora solifontis]NES56542.1 hypothetical protein [Micromonospora sp. PPF5-6]RNL97009.1 hypothetical protein EFE23_18515 [Micromonospora solifontis]